MKVLLSALFVAVLSVPLCANDGVYMSSGGAFYPTQETRISMHSEILSFEVRNRIAQVNIQFEFFNPDDIPRTLYVGFQAPTAQGDVPDSISNGLSIRNFTVMQDGRIIPYSLKIAECEECELKELGEIYFSQFESGVFVFLFEVTFPPGLTTINHSYSFTASSNVAIDQLYGYILETGSKWAGGKIGSLTVEIDLGENVYFFVNDIFQATAKWCIVGTGLVTGVENEDYQFQNARFIRVLSGHLQIDARDFSPQENIEFGIVSEKSFISVHHNYEEIMNGEVFPITEYVSADDSPRKLRLLRNTIYAQNGYAFRDEELMKYFEQFPWYIPDPNLKMADIELSEWEQEYVRKIQALEAAK